MHLSDGALQPPWLIAGGCGAFLLLALGLYRLRETEIPRVGLLTAALFVASQIHIPLGLGSVHLLLNGIAGILLGRHVGVALFVALNFQAFLFGHGGITTLGINTVILTVPAILGAYAFRLLLVRFPNRIFAVGILVGLCVSASTVGLNALVVWQGLEVESPAVALKFHTSRSP